jgi:glycosyltransferase involved in cell wall biosynthesis
VSGLSVNRYQTAHFILLISTSDRSGGAEKVAFSMFNAYRQRGYGSELWVGYRSSADPDIHLIPNAKVASWPFNWLWRIEASLQTQYGKVRGLRRLGLILRYLAAPGNLWSWYRGRELFAFPGTVQILRDRVPSIIHGHNLHGDYFDLTQLPRLSHAAPFALTLHDAWLLSGHCAHSFECTKWMSGCGHCPDLTIPPAIRRDATAENWKVKRQIYERCRLYVATPSSWLMNKVEKSNLAVAIAQKRVIPNGVALDLFRPANPGEARAKLGLPPDLPMILFVANAARHNPWKDYATLRRAIEHLATTVERPVLFIALGSNGPSEQVGSIQLRFRPFVAHDEQVAAYYQAANVYWHAALADTFPMAVLEALACGTPVVATAVGGIPEQVCDGDNGFLVKQGDAQAMAVRTSAILRDENLRVRLSTRAVETARARFDIHQQIDAYLHWYEEVIADWREWQARVGPP